MTNLITVILTANNVPVPTMFYVKVIPAADEPMFYPSSPSVGSFSSSTATATVRLPPGRVCVLTAYAGFTQLAGLFPLIDGELIASDSGSRRYRRFCVHRTDHDFGKGDSCYPVIAGRPSTRAMAFEVLSQQKDK